LIHPVQQVFDDIEPVAPAARKWRAGWEMAKRPKTAGLCM
jgi:hypothetical protein